MDVVLRRHLALLLAGVQNGDDGVVARLARSETHRLVGAIRASLRAHRLDPAGCCGACRATRCVLRDEISHALLPVRPAPADGG
ncbi:hypothetical protein [Gandjariella thermophila]|uniref:hypothetical protein n=1 Tax=Gandjariella thermophila TaxID=1931992 RepID=UPI00129BE23A|nr:hypothetical protein [Gandjariella thermophila]